MASLTLRNNHGIDTTDKSIRERFPAVFNQRRSTNVSEDYQLYKSDEVIKIMEGHGLRLVALAQEKMGWSRKRMPHTQIHTMRFMSPEIALRDFGVGDSRPEVVVMNSHDGRCTFKAMAGVFRLVCSNGMIVGDQQFGSVVRRHYGAANEFAKVKEIIADLPRVVEGISQRIARWSSLNLSAADQVKLAKLLMKDRGVPEWMKPEQVLEGVREGEMADAEGKRDLWTTFNVLQEHLTNSKVSRIGGEGRSRSIQPITGTVGNIRANQAIWTSAEAYFEGKVESLSADERAVFEELSGKRDRMKPLKRALVTA